MLRKEANKQILKILNILVDEYPDQRFGQLLVNYAGIADNGNFFTESKETLKELEIAIGELDED